MKRLITGFVVGSVVLSSAACTNVAQDQKAPVTQPSPIDDERLHGEPFQGFEKTELCEATYAAVRDQINVDSDDAPLGYPNETSGKEQVFCGSEGIVTWDNANAEIIFKVGFATIPPQ